MPKNNLKVVKSAARTGNSPPRTLKQHGTALWNRVTGEYAVEDAAGRALLTLACQALDRAEALRELIDSEGEMLQSRTGHYKEHPGLRHELQSRAFVAKMLLRLGLDVEPMRPGPGRPPKGGWSPSHDGDE
jgi:P27 family predicted phage terminase small subunit